MKCVRVLLWFVGDRMGLERIQCNLRNQTVQLVFVCFCSTVASGVQSSWTALNWQRVTQQRKKTKFDRIEAKIMSRTSFYYDCFDLHSQTPLICFIIRNFYLFHYIPRKISKISFYYFDFLFYLFSIYLFIFGYFFSRWIKGHNRWKWFFYFGIWGGKSSKCRRHLSQRLSRALHVFVMLVRKKWPSSEGNLFVGRSLKHRWNGLTVFGDPRLLVINLCETLFH